MLHGTIIISDGKTYFRHAAPMSSEPTMRTDLYLISYATCDGWAGRSADMDRGGIVAFRAAAGVIRVYSVYAATTFAPIPEPKVRGKCLGMRWNEGRWERLVGTRGWQPVG